MNSVGAVLISLLLATGYVVLSGIAIVLFLLTCVLLLELVAALRHHMSAHQATAVPGAASSNAESVQVVVVMPAHNEVGTIDHTLPLVMAALPKNGYVLVVADNCTDDTAAVARALGATVIERHDPVHIGKGYALGFAVRFLATRPPQCVIVLDADCVPDTNSLALLAIVSLRENRPVQARYDLGAPDISAGPLARVGTFAWRIKNDVRPTGLNALGAPCLLMGTGMAFPWSIIASASLDNSHLVEDMVLGLDLAARGQGTMFLPEACVRSSMPPSLEGQKSQRTRWETGHLQVIRNHVPRLIVRAVTHADLRLLMLALHTAVPPLAFYLIMLVSVACIAGLVAMMGGPAFAFYTAALATGIAGCVFVLYWYNVGRDVLTGSELLHVPWYLVSKLSMYGNALRGRQIGWVRSKRD